MSTIQDEAITRILGRPYVYPDPSTEKIIQNKDTNRENEKIESFIGENFPV
jgi:hypothetical protein